MGSRPLHSSRRMKAGSSVSAKSKSFKTKPLARKGGRTSGKRPAPPDFDAMLGRFSDPMSLIATATNAMVHAQHIPGGLNVQDVSGELVTLERGLRALRGVYDEFDVGIREVRT
jgi:hypothetical protein